MLLLVTMEPAKNDEKTNTVTIAIALPALTLVDIVAMKKNQAVNAMLARKRMSSS